MRRLDLYTPTTPAASVGAQCEALHCVVIGYNDVPFSEYEAWVGGYGENSEAYRDLRFSFVELGGGRKLDYIGLLNLAAERAERQLGHPITWAPLRSFAIPNLAAIYLTQFLRRSGFSSTYVNLFRAEQSRLTELLAGHPLAVAITTTFYLTNEPVREIVKFIRASNPSTQIIVGGPLVANHARSGSADELRIALSDIGADYFVVESQGEQTLAKLLDALARGESPSMIPNLAFMNGTRLERTETAPERNNLDSSFIDWSTFSDADLGATLQLRTARSCAFACSFCNYPTRAGALALAGLEAVERELDSISALGTIKNAVFIDDTFNVPLRRFKDLCRLIIRKRYQFSWFSYFRCSHADEEAYDLMAESGCRGVFLGVESGSPAILKAMNKRSDIDAYSRGISALRARGILTFASFIVGFPGETERTVEETAALLRSARPDFYRAQLWYNEPGTPVHGQATQHGITGSGFVWKHRTMDSQAAMDHIERLFLSVSESTWLPQFSFDFWTIPYLLGKGMSLDLFSSLMRHAERLIALSVAHVSEDRRREERVESTDAMVADIVAAEQLRRNALGAT
jgi:p-methyltransferase